MDTVSGVDTFRDLKNLRLQLSGFSASHIVALSHFHIKGDLIKVIAGDISLQGFSNMPPDPGDNDISIGSTATCIRSLISCPDFIRGTNIDYSDFVEALKKRLKARKLKSTGLLHLNPFTVGQLLPVLKDINAPARSALVGQCIRSAKTSVDDDGVRIGKYRPNGYLTYWALFGLDKWDQKPSECGAKSLEWSRNQLYRQLSLFAAGDDEESDAFQLGYNLLIQYRYCRENLRETIVEQALRTLFDAQLPRGVWEKKDPLFVYGGAGDAYCFSFELLSSLLKEFQKDEIALIPYAENLRRAFHWIRRNVIWKWKNPCWRSGHRVDKPDPESWATAEVYHYLQLYHQHLSQRIQQLSLKDFKGTILRSRPDREAFSKMYNPDIVLIKEGLDPLPLDKLLRERLLEPLKLDGKDEYSLVRNPRQEQLIRSGILFGPPGTGKTSYVKAIAKYLGWPLVFLDPSDFAKEGFILIPTVTSSLFESLIELQDTVIFFDEMEVLIRRRRRDRDEAGGEAGGFEEKFLTTSLLPKLQELYDKATALFFVATNHFEDIDEAATRESRFDFKIQMMPASFKEKKRWMEYELGKDVIARFADELDHADDHIAYATRGEMLSLIQSLSTANTASRARAILKAFEPKLWAKKSDLDQERLNNVFEKRK